MKTDENKTKEQLIEELASLRQRVTELEASETERKRVEEALQESEENFRDLAENSPHGVIIADENAVHLYANRRAAEITGYSVDELVGMSGWELTRPDEIEMYKERMRKRLAGEPHPKQYERIYVRKDGTEMVTEFTTTVTKWKGKICLMATICDITEHKWAEEKIQHLNLVLQAIRSVNQLITQENDRDRLLQGICDKLTQTRGYYNTWIALFDESGGFLTQAEAGLGQDFLPMVKRLKSGEMTNCARRALKQAGVVVTEDPQSTCADCPLSMNYGDRGALTIRLMHGGKIYGLLSTSIPRHLPTSEEEQHLFGEVARDIAAAVHNIDLEEQRKLAEETLRQTEEFSSSLLDNSPTPILVVNQDTSLRYVNPALEKLTGFSSAELAGVKAPYPWWTEETLQKTSRDMEEAIHKGARRLEELFQKKNGELFWVEITSEPVTRDGEFQYYLSNWVDITERRQAETALRQSEQKHRMLIESLHEGVWLIDKDAYTVFVNPRMAEMLGYTVNEMLGRHLFSFMDEAGTRLATDLLRKRKTGVREQHEFGFIRKDGTRIYTILATSPITDDEGKYAGAVAGALDITERRQMEEEKRKLEQKAQLASRLASVGEMASGIAHEINNPLTGVIGYAEMLMKKDVPEDMKEGFEIINEGARRVADIVNRLLTFARQQKLERDYVNINNIITTTLALRAYELETSNIKLTTYLDPELPATIADGGQLQQVFLNLIINAETEIKLARGKGNLLIKTETVGNTIRISFRDDGPGIKEENLNRVFDPFFTTREVGKGTGLGLSVCHGIMSEHGGSIHAESKPGKGATFIVELPVVTKPEQLKLAEPDAEEVERLAGAKILVVDDEPTIRTFVSRTLTDEGHQVESVDNAEDALEKIRSQRYNLILLDIKLPGMSGIELYRHIEKVAPSSTRRVVFITGDVIGARTTAFLSRTKAPYIGKPFDATQLKKEINRTLTESTA